MFGKKSQAEPVSGERPVGDTKALAARHAELMARLAAKRGRDIEALEKPEGKYRVVKIEYPPQLPRYDAKEPPPTSGWYVQWWHISSHGYGDADGWRYRPFDLGWSQKYDLEHLSEDGGRVSVIWDKVWSGAFPSKREAERFLKSWLKPDPGTLYNEAGEAIGAAQ